MFQLINLAANPAPLTAILAHRPLSAHLAIPPSLFFLQVAPHSACAIVRPINFMIA